MVKTIMANAQTTPDATDGTGATQYISLVGTQGFSTSEPNRQTSMLTAGTMSNLYLILTANTVAAVSTLQFRKNTINGNMTLSIASNTTGTFEDNVNTDSITAADKVNVSSVPGAAVGSYSYSVVSTHFQPTVTDKTTTHLGSACGAALPELITMFLTLSSDYNANVNGELIEANTKLEIRRSGTFKNLSVNITANNATSAATSTFRVNGTNTALTVSITPSTTGFFENTANSISALIGDALNHMFQTGAGPTLTVQLRDIAVEFETTNGYGFGQAANVEDTNHGTIIARQTTSFLPIIGGITSGLATESSMQIRMRSNLFFSDLSCLVSANTNADSSTLLFRLNGANGNNTLSIAGLTTGYFRDTTHTDSVTATTDLACLELITGTGAGTQTTTLCYTYISYVIPVISTGVFLIR